MAKRKVKYPKYKGTIPRSVIKKAVKKVTEKRK